MMEEPAAPRPDWAAVRADYDARMSYLDIIARHPGVTQNTLAKRRKREGWPLRRRKATNAEMLQRMIRAMLQRLSFELCEPDPALSIKEKLAALRTLHSSLDRFNKDKQKENDAARLALEPGRIRDARRQEIACRLEALGRQVRLGGGDPPPH